MFEARLLNPGPRSLTGPPCRFLLMDVTIQIASCGFVFDVPFVRSHHNFIMKESLRVFEKNSENAFYLKMVESKNCMYWYHQIVLLESFPMNGHVGRFWQS
jgi:hypothetical protein